jgi:hypothetical protein
MREPALARGELLRLVPSDSDPELRAHFRFDRIVCSNPANNAAGETPLSWRSGHLAGDDSSAIGARPHQ